MTTTAATAVRRRRRGHGGETTAARQRRDDGGKAATTMKKKEVSSWFSYFYSNHLYLCPLLVIFAILSSYLFPAVVFHLFYCLVQKFNFWRAPGRASFLTRVRVNGKNWRENSKISFFHYLRSLRDSLAQFWILNFLFLFFQKCFLLFQFKVSQLGDCNAIRLFKLSKLFTSKADHKERTTFLRAKPS